MAVLNDLPYETLVEILSSLSSVDLAHMSRVSHRFHSIARPLLYKAPCLTKTPDLKTSRPSLEIFVQTLLSPGCETLANHVRSLIWHQDDSQPNHVVPSEGNTALFAAASNRLNLRQLPRSENGEFPLLLHLLPYLQVLTIYPTCDRSLNALIEFSSLLSSATPTLPIALQSLREFNSPDDVAISPEMLLTLLGLPRITSINGRIANLPRVPADFSAAARTSSLTKLRITNSTLSHNMLSLALAVPRALTHFSYSTSRVLSYRRVGTADSLLPMRDSLECLHLKFLHVRQGVARSRAELGRVLCCGGGAFTMKGRSLRGWNVLRSLSCSLGPLLWNGVGVALRLVDVLPGGIREMEILEDCHWAYGEVVNLVVELLEQKEVVVPVLERLAVVNTKGEQVEAKEILIVACMNAGVTLVEDSLCW